ncbi:HAD family hydrolase [Pseudoneobacillus sp. C159]
MKALIFDFDGTIIDTETLWFKVFKEVLAEDYGIDLPITEFAKVIGTTDEVLYSYIESQQKGSLDRVTLKRKVYERFQTLKGSLVLRDGVEELIEEAKRLGLKLAIASSSERKWIEDFLVRFQIREHFPIIKAKEDVSKVKPDPELYHKAIEELGILPHEAIAVEDSVNGSIAALSAGVSTIVVPNEVTSFLEFDPQALIFNRFAEVNLRELC